MDTQLSLFSLTYMTTPTRQVNYIGAPNPPFLPGDRITPMVSHYARTPPLPLHYSTTPPKQVNYIGTPNPTSSPLVTAPYPQSKSISHGPQISLIGIHNLAPQNNNHMLSLPNTTRLR